MSIYRHAGKTVITSDHALKLESVPDWIAIVGSGYIGLEFSDVYTALGSEVDIYCNFFFSAILFLMSFSYLIFLKRRLRRPPFSSFFSSSSLSLLTSLIPTFPHGLFFFFLPSGVSSAKHEVFLIPLVLYMFILVFNNLILCVAQVTFIEALDQIMPGFDPEISKLAQRVLINPRKIDYHTGVFATKVLTILVLLAFEFSQKLTSAFWSCTDHTSKGWQTSHHRAY